MFSPGHGAGAVVGVDFDEWRGLQRSEVIAECLDHTLRPVGQFVQAAEVQVDAVVAARGGELREEAGFFDWGVAPTTS